MGVIIAILVILLISIIPLTLEAFIVEKMTLDDELIVLTPRRLYDNSNMNMFGCCVVTGICRIINPLGTIGKFIHFIFTIGRKS